MMKGGPLIVAGERFERLSSACEEKYQKIAELHARAEILEESIRQFHQLDSTDPSLRLRAANLQISIAQLQKRKAEEVKIHADLMEELKASENFLRDVEMEIIDTIDGLDRGSVQLELHQLKLKELDRAFVEEKLMTTEELRSVFLSFEEVESQQVKKVQAQLTQVRSSRSDADNILQILEMEHSNLTSSGLR